MQRGSGKAARVARVTGQLAGSWKKNWLVRDTFESFAEEFRIVMPNSNMFKPPGMLQ